MKFTGDILITDPCYIVRSEEDWQNCKFGEDLSALGLHTFLTGENGDTVGQSVKNIHSGNILGTFCTDSCMVSVMLLAEVTAYNPDFRQFLSEDCYTVIPDFNGNIERVEILDDDNQTWAFTGTGNIDFRTDAVES